ncbi:TIGR02679 domain-containing protein [Clostridium sp. Marseille-P2415]|uniref:TIGR02679 domain-containing protein n=1 Tax=Clostridium sp. Marseille-P2415 TaxID=1805471 RepID=UPI00135639DF|nr:TIGR02679 domain-containing protein [Clostridium sp. Marseille-P2415]
MEIWNESEMLVQAAEYFKKPGFERLFAGLRQRYGTLSRLGGSICLNALTKEEAEALEGFLQINVPEGSRLTVSVSRIRKALKHTRYDKCTLEELVPFVLKEKMISNKEERTKKELEMQAFLDSMQECCYGTPAGEWLVSCLVKGNPLTALISRDYHSDRDWLTENLPLIIKAVNRLPALTGTYLRLPVFAASITGNPHYFDEGKRSLKYLLYGIRSLFGSGSFGTGNSEEKTELLYRGGIVKDDLSNWVLCYGIHGYVSDKELHRGMEEYLKREEPQILTLKNLSALKSAAVEGKEVYIVENPSVFSWIVENSRERCACICSGGQLRLSVLVLLDLLAERGVTLYYSGDFDPEGLAIAQKLVSRYGNRLKLWCYHEEIYLKAISSETISEKRLKQLDCLTDERLAALGRLLREYRCSGYQENVMECFI